MRRMKVFIVLATFLLVAGVLLGKEEGEMKVTEYVLAWPRFDTVSAKNGDKALSESVEAYYKAGHNLSIQLRESKTNVAKTYAIYLLGTLRAKQAVRDLVKVIDFKTELVEPALRISRWRSYPAKTALSQIGMPSVGPVVKALGKEDNETRRNLMLSVLREVLDKDIAKFVIQKAIKTAKDDEKLRYEKALSILGGK